MSNQNYSHQVHNELIKLLYRQIRVALWAESIAAIFLTLALWSVTDHVILTFWLLTNLFFCGALRHFLVFKFNRCLAKSNNCNINSSYWLILFSIGALISGLSWGVTGSLLLTKNNFVIQTFQVFLLLGVTAAANPFYSPYRYIYALFLIPAFVPFSIWLILQGGVFVTLGCLAVVYMLILLATSYYSNRLIVDSLQLRFNNLQLLDDLAFATVSLEDRTYEAEKSLSLIKATLDATTNGILVIDSHNRITNYNQKFIEMWKIPSSLKMINSSELINYMSHQLIEPDLFKSKLKYETNDLHYNEEIKFNDDRIFELYSQPQIIGKKYVGRVFSFRDITSRKVLESKLYHQANYDSLTGLPNRSLVLDRLSQALIAAKRNHSHVGVLFIDVDRFKLINDTLGHNYGDTLLKSVAERLEKCIRANDTVSRTGGDEFVIILNSLQKEDDAISIVKSCLNAFHKPFIINNNSFNVTTSIGISFFPRDGQDIEILIRNADIAMYRAKELGRNNFQFFTSAMNNKVQTRLAIENQLREAIRHNQLSLLYQPILNLNSHKITGVEALLRWNHPALGNVSPKEFISVAEESGMIIQIGEWVLQTVCQQITTWRQLGLDLSISVNLSPTQFKQANLPEKLNAIIQTYQTNPKKISLEFTEKIMLDDIESTIAILSQFKKIGVDIAIDNFGMGYSSLINLKRLPIDVLKIDISYIKDISYQTDSGITAAIIALAKKLNIKVIAKGVENETQMNYLANNQCDEIQGYYISKPLSASDCVKLLTEKELIESNTV